MRWLQNVTQPAMHPEIHHQNAFFANSHRWLSTSMKHGTAFSPPGLPPAGTSCWPPPQPQGGLAATTRHPPGLLVHSARPLPHLLSHKGQQPGSISPYSTSLILRYSFALCILTPARTLSPSSLLPRPQQPDRGPQGGAGAGPPAAPHRHRARHTAPLRRQEGGGGGGGLGGGVSGGRGGGGGQHGCASRVCAGGWVGWIGGTE